MSTMLFEKVIKHNGLEWTIREFLGFLSGMALDCGEFAWDAIMAERARVYTGAYHELNRLYYLVMLAS
jgi:hypothetical protein